MFILAVPIDDRSRSLSNPVHERQLSLEAKPVEEKAEQAEEAIEVSLRYLTVRDERRLLPIL
jgi:hypothetical protein